MRREIVQLPDGGMRLLLSEAAPNGRGYEIATTFRYHPKFETQESAFRQMERDMAKFVDRKQLDGEWQPSLWDDPTDIKGMVRGNPHDTEVEAARRIAQHCRTQLHHAVLEAFRVHGLMTDEELENLPQFARYGISTVKKRRTELYQAGLVVDSGMKRMSRGNVPMIVWKLAEGI